MSNGVTVDNTDHEKALGDPYLQHVASQDQGDLIIMERPKVLTKLNHFLSRLGGEERGIERVHEHEKTDQVRNWLFELG
jgi:hypothetical protein